MKIDAKLLDKERASLTQQAEQLKEQFFRCSGALQMVEHLKAKLAEPDPEPVSADDAAAPDTTA